MTVLGLFGFCFFLLFSLYFDQLSYSTHFISIPKATCVLSEPSQFGSGIDAMKRPYIIAPKPERFKGTKS